ncbi:hypothetical protein [Crateriforma spongiae]|uniref:hypothetical protein n=1 Tax=Crateriforma spongiae TaxID=2724528 RepID=UPI0039AEE95A
MRTIIVVPIAFAIWHYGDRAHWVTQALLAMLTAFCVAGLAFGLFRGYTGR